jgi:hypothetical protein
MKGITVQSSVTWPCSFYRISGVALLQLGRNEEGTIASRHVREGRPWICRDWEGRRRHFFSAAPYGPPGVQIQDARPLWTLARVAIPSSERERLFVRQRRLRTVLACCRRISVASESSH